MHSDIVVLGAGIIGVCVAWHLQKRGRAVVLVDRRGVAEETSYGNAGLVQREAVYPYAFPRDWGAIARYALNRSVDMHYHPAALPSIGRFLWRYWKESSPKRHAAIARSYAKLIERCVSEHAALAAEAGAGGAFRPAAWLKVFRTETERDARFAEAERWDREYGIRFRALDAAGLHELEPQLEPGLAGALHFTDTMGVDDPRELARAYARHFEALGGRFVSGDATSLEREGEGWRLSTPLGPLAASSAVIALGPWSDDVTRRLGYRLPLAVKRGYHMHYRAAYGARLDHVVLDSEGGYVLAPMRQGIRLTTGAEFARRDAPRTPVQLDRAEPIARKLFPLGERMEAQAWMGARSCTPDMLPVIGKAPRHENLWFAFGHAHHGLTLGPVTGRLLAELVTQEPPFVDPTPYAAARFAC